MNLFRRASTLDNAVEFMKVDHTRCCSTQKKKATEQGSEVPKKRKRKTSVDPDFDPHRECDSPQPSTSGNTHYISWDRCSGCHEQQFTNWEY